MSKKTWKVLVLASEQELDYEASRLKDLTYRIAESGFEIFELYSLESLESRCTTQREIVGVIIDWRLEEEQQAKERVLESLRKKFSNLPIFIIAERVSAEELSYELLGSVTGYYWLDDDTINFMAGRISHEINAYIDGIYPPFFRALKKYVETYKYAWHTPGHMGGRRFLEKSCWCGFL